MSYIPFNKIPAHLSINPGETVYVISDILELAKTCREHGEIFDCAAWIRSLQELVGSEGTLLFPTFNWDFCKGKSFDIRKTKGKTGALGNTALNMPGFIRTRHPIYSFAVWGRKSQELEQLDNIGSFGVDSPFGYLYDDNARCLVIGLPANRENTFLYYIEQRIGVPYRYHKEFSAPYTDADGMTETKTYSMYVRDLKINPTATGLTAMDEMMTKLNIIQSTCINGVPFHLVSLQGMYSLVSLDIRFNSSRNIYVFPEGMSWNV